MTNAIRMAVGLSREPKVPRTRRQHFRVGIDLQVRATGAGFSRREKRRTVFYRPIALEVNAMLSHSQAAVAKLHRAFGELAYGQQSKGMRESFSLSRMHLLKFALADQAFSAAGLERLVVSSRREIASTGI